MKWKVANVQEDSGSYYIRLYEGTRRKKIKLGRLDEFPSRESLVAVAHEMSLRTSSRPITHDHAVSIHQVVLSPHRQSARPESDGERI